ncbi:MAG: iron-containing alcohol dehydrogenase [Planctomycetaceae bacterium]|nr:iron-containing alcohol dehydrogenase [Planctomycetales bacterium]MCB9921086.1 iron-containing alcohol dehydrogenase [Planctomycetaceae bacterium]
MTPFDFQLRTRIVFGPDTIDKLGELASELGARRALVVSDPGVIAAGHTQRGLDALARAGIEAHLFEGVHENPSTDDVDRGVAAAKRHDPELLVGLGGGSSMDCAKGINFLYSNGGKMQDYWGVGKALKPMLPMIAVPTTSGTGSETQSFALISDAKTHAKMACGDKKASCRIAILDPKLTLTQPPRVTALTGIDAIAHALETYVTKPRNPVSLLYSREAWRLLAGNFGRVLEDPTDLEARSAMQLGATYAGVAIENSMLGATHALANPLTARYGIVHGEAIGMMLPHVIRFNGEKHDDWYRELLEASCDNNGMPRPSSGPSGLADFISTLVKKAGLATRLPDRNVDESQLADLAAAAATQWTGTFNPREVGEPELLGLYRQAF